MDQLQFTVGSEDQGIRLDRFLTSQVKMLGRAEAGRLIARGKVRVDGELQSKGYALQLGQRVALAEAPHPRHFTAAPDSDLPLEIRYEDAWLIVVDKPAGVPSYPLRPEERGTVANALMAHDGAMASAGIEPQQAGLVHRLDTGTSGLILAAKSRAAFERLRGAIRSGELHKHYLALCQGHVVAPQTIDAWVVSPRSDNRKVRISQRPTKRGRAALTELVAATPIKEFTLVEARAGAAARHQIRAHLAWIGHPLVGDTLYGGPRVAGIGRHFLHANELRFTHPINGQTIRVSSPLATELLAVIEAIQSEVSTGSHRSRV